MQLLRLSLFDFAVIFFASSAVVFGPITSAVLWRSPLPNTKATRWFTLLILAVSAYLITEIISFGDFYSISSRFYYSPLRFTFAFGPLFFFYVKQLILPDYQFRQWDWIHFLLPGAQLLLSLGLGFQSAEIKHLFWQQISIPWYDLFDTVWTAVSILGYGAASIWAILQKDVQVHKKRFVWTIIAVFLLCGLITLFLDVLLVSVLNIELYNYPFWVSFPVIFYSFSLVFIATKGILFHNMPVQKQRRETYGIDAHHLTNLATRLNELMETDMPYLDPNLTLSRLAKQMKLPSKHLSYLINESAGKSYNDFINGYRIKMACQLLKAKSREQQTILDIALQSGFSSKSTFNRLFRDYMQKTPTQFRNEHSE